MKGDDADEGVIGVAADGVLPFELESIELCGTPGGIIRRWVGGQLAGLRHAADLQATGEDRKPCADFSESIVNGWSQRGSNSQPSTCKADALPIELWPLLGRILWDGDWFDKRGLIVNALSDG